MRPAAVTYVDPDQSHEDRISAELAACEHAQKSGHTESAQRHWKRFVELIEERSAEKVRKMEIERGLHAT
jgi:hypothetical protein